MHNAKFLKPVSKSIIIKVHLQRVWDVISKPNKMKHKFLSDSEMSYEEVFKFTYDRTFIPFLIWLGAEIGEDKMLAHIKKWIENTNKIKKSQLNYGMKKFVEVMKKPDTFYDHVTTYEIVEESAQSFEIKITECLWAKVFREADA
jgi:hypothetical protein